MKKTKNQAKPAPKEGQRKLHALFYVMEEARPRKLARKNRRRKKI